MSCCVVWEFEHPQNKTKTLIIWVYRPFKISPLALTEVTALIHERFSSSSYTQPVQEVMRFTFLMWTKRRRRSVSHRKRWNIWDLTHLFLSLPPSQGKVAQTACMSACKHISTSLMQLLLDQEVRQISMGALHQIHTDVKECESECRLLLSPISDSLPSLHSSLSSSFIFSPHYFHFPAPQISFSLTSTFLSSRIIYTHVNIHIQKCRRKVRECVWALMQFSIVLFLYFNFHLNSTKYCTFTPVI